MLPDTRFLKLPKHFWANVRAIGQHVGYSVRGKGTIKTPSIEEIDDAYRAVGLSTNHLVCNKGVMTGLGKKLIEYFDFRAGILNTNVANYLMDVDKAKTEYNRLKRRLDPTCPLPMNKQRGDKKAPAYFTCIINMLIEEHAGGVSCDYDPRKLAMITKNNTPLRTFSRRLDGAFPNVINPVAIWEIKEYYYTTTFGSRVAGGVYETLLDGMEIEELSENEGIDVKHLLMIDDYNTWWNQGKSYLCRIIDMLHMGYVDEVLFGSEVLERLPIIVREWVSIDRS